MVGAVLLVGAFVSGIYPTLSAYAVDTNPSYSGPVNAIATGASYLGLSIAPAVIGVIATWYDIGTALSLLTVVVGVLAVIVATLRFKLGPSGVV